MQLTKEQIEELKDWGYSVETNPLKITRDDNNEVMVGIIAELFLKENLEDDEDNSIDLSELQKLDDDVSILVSCNVNYADEFDMSEWKVYSAEEFKKIVNFLENYDDDFEIYFGTNEEFRFDDGKDLLNHFTYKVITEQDSDTLSKLFDGEFDGGSGIFDYIENELMIEDEDEDEDEEVDEYDNILTAFEIKLLSKLQEFGWKITYTKDYLFEYTHDEHGTSIAGCDMLHTLNDYYKKQIK